MENWFTKGLASLAVPMMIAVYYLVQPNGDQIVLITGLLVELGIIHDLFRPKGKDQIHKTEEYINENKSTIISGFD